jgi:hypothetical protein
VYLQFRKRGGSKKNLQNKIKVAFINVKGKKKSGPEIDIDLKLSYAEAKATTAITVTGCNTLSASVEQLGNAYICNQVSPYLVKKMQDKIACTNTV